MPKKKDEPISAFAYNTAKKIEEMVIARVGLIQEENNLLKAQMLSFREKLRAISEKTIERELNEGKISILVLYDKHFSIETPERNKYEKNSL